MDQKTQFIADYLRNLLCVTELCALYGISPKTGFTLGWINVSLVRAGEYVGLEEIDDRLWNVYFRPLKLGRLHEPHMRTKDEYGKLKRK